MSCHYLTVAIGILSIAAYYMGAPLALVAALFMGTLVARWSLGKPYVAIRADRVHLLTYKYPDTNTMLYRISYEWPETFFKYSILYDPLSLDFDAYRISTTTNRAVTNQPKVNNKGSPSKTQPDKFVIDVYPARYNPPRSLSDGNRIVSIDILFFFKCCPDSTATLEAFRDKVQYRKHRTPDTFESLPLGTGFR